MGAAAGLSDLQHTFVDDLDGLYEHWQPSPVPEPRLLALNEALAGTLGLDIESLRSDVGVAILAGNAVPDGARPVAQAYAGHQFGGYSPRLGDGRALLLGEIVAPDGARSDVHLKGSGRTPFARGGDGKAAVGPMLREYLIGEAMHALGVPTTRMLAVVATGELVARDEMLPGAVLTRIASSHLRVGTFQFAAATGGPESVQRLVDHAIARHHPDLDDIEDAPGRARALFDRVVAAQASLIAQWMLVGFVHGVMNTDNTTISGETIDYGPCAFIDVYDPTTVFSSIDHGGRYAYGNQPSMAAWNLARLAEAMLPVFDADDDAAVEQATDVLQRFPGRFGDAWLEGMRRKLGLSTARNGDDELVDDYLTLLRDQGIDFTSSFRALAAVLRDDAAVPAVDDARWVQRWRDRVASEAMGDAAVARRMDRLNPVYVPRNHLVEEALAAATAGDLAPFEALTDVLADPYVERPGLERFAVPAPDDFGSGYRTFCGT